MKRSPARSNLTPWSSLLQGVTLVFFPEAREMGVEEEELVENRDFDGSQNENAERLERVLRLEGGSSPAPHSTP